MKGAGNTNLFLWSSGAAFVLLSAAAGAGWLYRLDVALMEAAQSHTSGLLDDASGLFSALGSWEVTGALLLMFVAVLFLLGRRRLPGRLLFAFLATGFLELLLKMFLPVPPIPDEAARSKDFAPFTVLEFPYPYPSGHALRSVLLLGAVYLLSESMFLKAGLAVMLLGMLTSRVYLGVHWTSDVIGGALLGLTAVSWVFEKEDRAWRSP